MKNRINLKKSTLFLLLLAFTSCQQQKFLNFATILEVDISSIDRDIDLKSLVLIYGPEEIMNDQKDTQQNTLTEIVYWDDNTDLNHTSGDALIDDGSIYINSNILTIIIPNFVTVDPWKSEITFILFERTDYYGTTGEVDFIFDAGYSRKMDGLKLGEATAKIKAKRVYGWDLKNNTINKTGEKTKRKEDYNEDSNASESSINGKWMAISGCSNSNGERNWFNFSSGGSGQSFQADCNNTCIGLGVKFNFSYEVSGASIIVTWISVGDYCNVSSTAPTSPESLDYKLSGDILNINGMDYKKQ